ncbi:uncharacterized protein MEPE_00977 [Melanopsichium pennsylvanicum]|uniref:Uncharacterized protein n=2 Tax=Melanopsichium pennsylvanicum TaxID=63383 RepID=A0AAJ4XID7_9BASI|nr:putative protein [Melanopsichium pennsylvanicum 4]SNX82271.1 uncharacterized protein MEPE_00977 [Melanopsichium pennsylvanicum]
MRPTAQHHQRSYRQESWQAGAQNASNGPASPSSAIHAATPYVPLPPSAPALPPPRPFMNHPSSPTSAAIVNPYPFYLSPASQLSYTPDSHSPGPEIPPFGNHDQRLGHAPVHPSQPTLSPRLVNPYEQMEQFTPSNTVPVPHPSSHRTGSRLSFGPGDPLFSDHRASMTYPAGQAPRPPPSPRPYFANPMSSPLASTSSSKIVQRAASSTASRSLSQNTTPRNNTSAASHGRPGHEFDNCPGCRAEMDDTIKASLQSALQEDDSRRRQLQEQQELERVYAKNAEESERQRRLAQEEEQLIQKAIEDSRREAEMQSLRSKQEEALVLEESRQYALREREREVKLEAQMLEAAKSASTTHEQERRLELDAMHDAEKRALELSLQEQEDEWARRESAERSLLEFLEHGGIDRSATPLSSAAYASSSSTSHSSADNSSSLQEALSSSAISNTSDANNLEAEYWRFAGHDEAYQLALQMQRTSLSNASQQDQPGLSQVRTRRPLPQTPQGPERSASHHEPTRKHDPLPATSQPALEDAPPAYAEATQPGPSRITAQLVQTPEKAPSHHYDAVTLQDLSRPVLQQRSLSSSSGRSHQSHLEGHLTPLSSAASPGLVKNSNLSPAPSGSAESSPGPYGVSASPSIPGRGSSHSTPVSKRSSTSVVSLPPEQRGQRALAGVEFGFSNLPFAPKLDRSRLPSAQSASTAVSASSGSTSATAKLLFPASIELPSVSKLSAHSSQGPPEASFFVLRAYSWKSLLRAIAWYGNSRVEAAPEEVAAANDRHSRCLLQAEVEFVTPTRVDLGYGVGEYARVSQNTGSMPKNPSPTHVALCLSLLPIGHSKDAGAWLKSEGYQVIKRESRRLDAWYAGRGSTRRLIQLARQPPALPVTFVEVAQLLHASHTFSAACPSSGSVARHSPRDLHHAIERHDEGFVRKQKAMLAAGSALTPQSGGLISTSSLASSNPRLSMQGPNRTSHSTELLRNAEDDDDVEDDEDEMDINDFGLLEQGLATNGSFDAQDKVLMGKRQRLKAKVKRRLAKRNADGRIVDEDLAAWITPFDLSQHG